MIKPTTQLSSLGCQIRNPKQYQMTKIRNDRNGNISRRTGTCFEHLNFGFRIFRCINDFAAKIYRQKIVDVSSLST